MNLDKLGQWLLPWLDDVLDEAVGVITDLQLYVQRWREVLDV